MCVVINLDVVCLVCLHHSAEIEMHSIFQEESDENGIQIAHKISTLSKLNVDSKNEHLPDKICDGCLKDLRAAWRFHKNCQTAVAVFQSILKPIVLQEQCREKKIAENQEKEKEPSESAETTEQQTFEMTIKELIDEEHPKQQQETSVMEANEENQSINLEPIDVDAAEELVTPENETKSKFVELRQCITQEDTEDYQSVDETTGQEVQELVEYLTDEQMSDGNTELKRIGRIAKTKQPRIINTGKGISTIASKKLIVNPPRPDTKLLVSNITKGITTRTVTRAKPQNEEKGSEVSEVIKTAKPVRRRDNQQFIPSNDSHQQVSSPNFDSDDNANPINDDDSEKTNPSRKRKANSGAAKAPKICEICGNSYRFQHALKAHMRRHYDDKPFPCEMCSKAFVSNVELRRHMRVHTGQKPYACQYCDRRFSDYGSRIKHERTHTGERPYVCTTCGKSFAYPHVLSVHLRTHTGEKKFKCNHCPKGFTKKAYLQTHMDTYHSNVGDVTTYELTMEEEDDDGDTVETDNEQLNTMDSILTSEFINGPQQDSDGGGVQHHKSDNEDIAEDYDDDNNSNDGDQMLVPNSLLHLKSENDAEDDNDCQEVEIHLDEYTIRCK
ncbi:uncharacterized protein [Musca autumnalis]|uniref:uncharacterized protein n=1 Tax=Musca autumnalis TaxID=221902 RepID=UPI003CE98023